MKKTIAVIGSAAALSFSGAGLAAAQSELPFELPGAGSSGPAADATDDTTGDDTATDETGDDTTGDDTATDETETPAEVSQLAEQLCGAVVAVDVLGSVGTVAPGLEGEDCTATVDEAFALAQEGDIEGALDLIRGVEADEPTDTEGEVDTEQAGEDTAATEGATEGATAGA